MDAVDVLIEARPHIEKGWCQNTHALGIYKDEYGSTYQAEMNGADLWDKRYYSQIDAFCAEGAVWWVMGEDSYHSLEGTALKKQVDALLNQAAREVSMERHPDRPLMEQERNYVGFNDLQFTTRGDVLELFDRAIRIGSERADAEG